MKRRASEPFPAELEQRISTLENPANQGTSFDAASWVWLLLLGVALPVVLVIWARG